MEAAVVEERVLDVHVRAFEPLVSPVSLREELPASAEVVHRVREWRAEIGATLRGEDSRLLVVVGPCSIHDTDAALEYARGLQPLRQQLGDALLIVMRAYFEKPRTTVGWKGLINDPHLDGRCDVETGVRRARGLLLQLAELGVPTAGEMLDPIVPQYIADLMTWSAIGARTTESQTHREMASGLSMPVGFKNGTDGSLDVAINGMRAAAEPHAFLGIDDHGRVAVVRTSGNPDCHAVLRGGTGGPNYAATAIRQASEQLERAGVNARVMVDCSHANSEKRHENQVRVAQAVADQVRAGGAPVLGVMLESNLLAGRQDFPASSGKLTYGQSITDACIDWPTTAQVLQVLADAARAASGGC